jgi:hypothetical protein
MKQRLLLLACKVKIQIKALVKSALTRLEALLGLIDDENAAFATNQLVVSVALHQRLK